MVLDPRLGGGNRFALQLQNNSKNDSAEQNRTSVPRDTLVRCRQIIRGKNKVAFEYITEKQSAIMCLFYVFIITAELVIQITSNTWSLNHKAKS